MRDTSPVFTVSRQCDDSHVIDDDDQGNDVVVKGAMRDTVRQARADIRRIVRRNRRMGAKFLRLMFHDCVGGCDGACDCRHMQFVVTHVPNSHLVVIFSHQVVWTLKTRTLKLLPCCFNVTKRVPNILLF